jgi:uridine kinase
MLARRIRRDVKERGRTVEGVLDQYGTLLQSVYTIPLNMSSVDIYDT